MEIIKEFIPVGSKNRSGIKMDGPKWITIHDTGNSNQGANAENHAKYLRSGQASASWHFTVDDKQIIQHLPLDIIGWHAGDGGNGPGNRSSIGIEICENKDGDRVRAEANAAKLVAYLMKLFSLEIERVVQHNRWSGKNCPRVIRARPGGWEGFLKEVGRNMDGKFSDISGHWAKGSIEYLAQLGIVNGRNDGTFAPDEPITRAEVAVMIAKTVEYMLRQNPR